ncbi:MAG: aldehyde ferredoxin oxidoreductase family protein [Candidatus Fermentithermobacillus carboniphilus]|uniref:Aldehyde ferredoxin oxidoreductase family protein n=1 Tax=Candidatus Fermentithermobacillus carboniphilus TaxID=3085328 RepID=A0AAT9LCE5_9FIRM|nr:MAG: aldehyde ferredoxin oxidoreductase family protein [Candidatus Fermentithermobacillus carboniphilus]
MGQGITGTIAYVDLSKRQVRKEIIDSHTFRKYFGGTGLIARHVLSMTKRGVDALGSENVFVYACGPLTGGPYAGSGRSAAGAKSPLTGGFGVGEGGGFIGAELRKAGFDAIVVTGVSETPVYLFAHDGELEIRDASGLWGKTTGETEEIIRQELGDSLIRVAQCGPAGEVLVRFAGVCNDLTHYIGRTGMGAVMGSKKLKAIAARGRGQIPIVDREKVREISAWMNQHWRDYVYRYHDTGTAGVLLSLQELSGLPTRNFREGQFEGAAKISGEALRDSLLLKRDTCYACPIRCKRVVGFDEPYKVDPKYGGPEYETIGSFGSTCGVDDLKVISKANEICNAYGIDTISAGVTIAFAMECFENGLLSLEDTDGIELRFGNGEAVLKVLQKIVKREGIGDLLANGSAYAAKKIGRGAEELAMQVRGLEVPMHEPRLKWGLGVGYGTSVTGADHCHNMHDPAYAVEGKGAEEARSLGVGDVPLPSQDLSLEKVMLLRTITNFRYFCDSAVMCQFLPYSPAQIVDLVKAVTGWDTGTAELLAVGERAHVMARLFNIREGMKSSDEKLPKRFFEAFKSGPLAGKVYTPEEWERAKLSYYRQSGWTDEGVPTEDCLARLGLMWAKEALSR